MGGTLVRHDTDLWSTEYVLPWQFGWVPIPVRTTVIRLADGQLIVHSPGPLTTALRAELDALGPVGFIVSPEAHGKYADEAARAWPAAQLLAAPRALAEQPPAAWSGQVETHFVEGFRLNEVVLFHRPTRTLLITDLCFNIQRAESATAKLFFRANGMWQRFGPSRIIRALALSDRAALARSLDQMAQWGYERIIPGHGEVLERGGPAALRAAWFGE